MDAMTMQTPLTTITQAVPPPEKKYPSVFLTAYF